MLLIKYHRRSDRPVAVETAAIFRCPEKESVAVATRSFVTISLVVGFAALAFAQKAAIPDLSGAWTLDPAKSKLVNGNHIQSETVAIASSGANIQFRYHAVPGGKDWTMSYTIDGKEHVIKKPEDDDAVLSPYFGHPLPPPCYSGVPAQQIYTKASWHKSELTVELRSRWLSGAGGIGCPGENDFLLSGDRWRVSPDGRVLTRIAERVHTSNADYPMQVFVYHKQ
jgi:hypothetical protein